MFGRFQLPVLGGLDRTGLGLSDSAVTDNINAGRFDGDLPGIGAIITAAYDEEARDILNTAT